MRRRYPKLTERRGAAAIELAVVLPVLMLLALGCVDFGRAVALDIALSNAARLGAEYGATHRFTDFTRASWESQMRQAAVTEMQGVRGFDGSQLSVSIQTTTDAAGFWRVRVATSYPFTTATSWPGLPHEMTIQQSVTMRQYQ